VLSDLGDKKLSELYGLNDR